MNGFEEIFNHYQKMRKRKIKFGPVSLLENGEYSYRIDVIGTEEEERWIVKKAINRNQERITFDTYKSAKKYIEGDIKRNRLMFLF